MIWWTLRARRGADATRSLDEPFAVDLGRGRIHREGSTSPWSRSGTLSTRCRRFADELAAEISIEVLGSALHLFDWEPWLTAARTGLWLSTTTPTAPGLRRRVLATAAEELNLVRPRRARADHDLLRRRPRAAGGPAATDPSGGPGLVREEVRRDRCDPKLGCRPWRCTPRRPCSLTRRAENIVVEVQSEK